MIDLLCRKILDRVRSCENNVADANPVHVHWNELIDYNTAIAAELIPQIASLLIRVAAGLQLNLSEYRLLCVVPFKVSAELDVSLPHFPISAESLGFKPISVYVTRRSDLLYYEHTEEYKCPVLDMGMNAGDISVVAWYRVFRSADEAAKGWEFSRCLYFEVLDNKLIVP